MSGLVDMTGATICGWLVVERSANDSLGRARWRCRCCDCGSERVIKGQQLRIGKLRTCECSPRVSAGGPMPPRPSRLLSALESAPRCPRCSLLLDDDEHVCIGYHGSLGLGGISRLAEVV